MLEEVYLDLEPFIKFAEAMAYAKNIKQYVYRSVEDYGNEAIGVEIAPKRILCMDPDALTHWHTRYRLGKRHP